MFYNQNEIAYLKRLIGMPHDIVTFVDGKVSVNGDEAKYTLAYEEGGLLVYEEAFKDSQTYLVQYMKHSRLVNPDNPIVINEGQYFFLGDNRDNSVDSRLWGGIPVNNIIGEVIYKIERKTITK